MRFLKHACCPFCRNMVPSTITILTLLAHCSHLELDGFITLLHWLVQPVDISLLSHLGLNRFGHLAILK